MQLLCTFISSVSFTVGVVLLVDGNVYTPGGMGGHCGVWLIMRSIAYHHPISVVCACMRDVGLRFV